MSTRIKNDSIVNLCLAIIVVSVGWSCQEQVTSTQTKIITKKMPDGSVKVIGATINGKREGLWVTYNDSGWVSSDDIYVNDSLTGESIGYFENGAILCKGTLTNGQMDGNWTFYYANNKIESKGYFKDGYRTGVWEYYIEEGLLDKKIEFAKDGKKKIIEDHHLTPPVPDN